MKNEKYSVYLDHVNDYNNENENFFIQLSHTETVIYSSFNTRWMNNNYLKPESQKSSFKPTAPVLLFDLTMTMVYMLNLIGQVDYTQCLMLPDRFYLLQVEDHSYRCSICFQV